VQFTFHQGIPHAKTMEDSSWGDWDVSCGLNVWVHLFGGTGYGPQSGRSYSGETFNYHSPDFYDPYPMRGALAKLLSQENTRGVEGPIAERREFLKDYRIDQALITLERMDTLSYDFWLEAYNADLEFGSVEDLLTFISADERLHDLVASCSTLFEDVLNVRNMLADRKKAFWFVLWHDIWNRNCNVPEFERARKQLNPWGEQFVGLEEPLTEDQLSTFLTVHGISSFFTKQVISSIYTKLNSL
jgi:hypothetical protein